MFKFLKKFLNIFKQHEKLFVAYDSGGNNKPTIVLLHGIAATSKSWEFLINELDTKKYRVIALDLLGFGQSPKPTDRIYDVFDHVKCINNTLDELNISQPFMLIGHSMGSIIALHYTRQYPHKVGKLFLLSLPLYTKSTDLSLSALARKQTDLYLNAYQFLSQKKNFSIKYSKKIRDFLHLNDGIDINENNWNAFRQSLINTVVKQNVLEDIKSINKPIQIIYGALDSLLVQENIIKLAKEVKNVNIIKVPLVHHLVDARFAKSVAHQIEIGEK